MKKLFALILALTMVLALCACGNTNAATTETPAAVEEKPVETLELKLAHNLAEDHPLHLAAMKFAEDVEAGTDGAVKVTVYGHVGAEFITLASMLRIPVCSHNLTEKEVFRPSLWNMLGGKNTDADFRACRLLGPLYGKY